MAKITYELLCAKGACKDQADTFKTLFPNGVEVTEELCREHAHTFTWGWAVTNLLTSEAWELYYETLAPSRKLYEKKRAQAAALYCETRTQAWELYKEKRAQAFATAYLSMSNAKESDDIIP